MGGEKTEYGYADGRLLFQICGSEKAWFEYASDGEPLYMVYNGTRHIYLKNAQGDIIGMRNESTKKSVFYTYDEWGVLYHINYEDGTPAGGDPAAKFNPLRYRGYVYDNETKFYYLNARYYDPQTTRYLNADAFVSTGQGLTGNNMFAYCGNNSPLFADPSGSAYVIADSGGSSKPNYVAPPKPPQPPKPSGNNPTPAPRPNKKPSNTKTPIDYFIDANIKVGQSIWAVVTSILLNKAVYMRI